LKTSNLISFLFFSLICSFAVAQNNVLPKAVDGTFTDWTTDDFSIDDAGDSQALDILKVSVANDAERLFLLLETNQEFDMQDDEDITVFIDADNDPSTGFSRGGIGAEFTYYYGARRGFINMADGTSTQVNHADLGAMSSPTVTSDNFELVLDRSVEANGFSATMESTISILIENDGAGDVVPNMDGGFQYTLEDTPVFQSQYNLDKDNNHVRFMSYNVLNDGIFQSNKQAEFEKIFTAMDPDIIAFQEVYNTSNSEIQVLLTQLLPINPGQTWQVERSNPDIVLATRFQIEAWDDIDGNAVFLIIDDNNEPILVYNVHLPCCDNDVQRQMEIDNLLSVLRDKEASSQTGFLYPEDAPTIITGDFNMVGLKQNYDSFIEGDIVDIATYGQDFTPDWDGSTMEDANPYVTGFPGNYTWNNPNGSYHPGKLDFLFYTGSVMEQQNGFVLDTEYLSEAELNSYNLSANTTTIASDHLPVVIDFTFGQEQLEDLDGDMFASDVDCNDNDPNIFPGATEVCDGVDNNCDGAIDEGIALTTYYFDADMDGFGDDNNSTQACQQPPGTSTVGGDCNDNDSLINPSGNEICNGIDDNCNGFIDDEDSTLMDAQVWYQDSDNDGFGNPMLTITACQMPVGYTANNTDCDDTSQIINPGTMEICDDLDNNCDGSIDEGIALMTFYEDLDQDGFGNDEIFIMSCFQPVGYILVDGDCNDMNASINPDAIAIPGNGVDEDCTGNIDDFTDEDGDGFIASIDCNDTDASINPDAPEICDGIDNNCDGSIDEGLLVNTYFQDNDMDGFGDDGITLDDCIQPLGYVLDGGDCDDASANVFPGAEELCDDIDNNCDGVVDEGINFISYYTDMDGDGFGDDDSEVMACDEPEGLVTTGGDCDDTEEDIYPGAPEEIGNGVDEDCDGVDLTSIHELEGVIFNVYPNPIHDKLYIDLDKNMEYSISIMNVDGKKVFAQNFILGNGEIDLGKIPKGIYFLVVNGIDKGFGFSERIVIH